MNEVCILILEYMFYFVKAEVLTQQATSRPDKAKPSSLTTRNPEYVTPLVYLLPDLRIYSLL